MEATNNSDNKLTAELLTAFRSVFGTRFVPIGELTSYAGIAGDKSKELQSVLLSIAGGARYSNREILRGWLEEHEGAIVSGLRLVRGETPVQGFVPWGVEEVSYDQNDKRKLQHFDAHRVEQ